MTLPDRAARALEELGRFGVHLGLGHVQRLLAALGDPHLAQPTVLVAGTNGKGSTAALLAAMATAAGRCTGLYTSPHLESVEERVRVDGRPVTGERLGAAVLEVMAAARRLEAAGDLDAPPTYFEAVTAAAALAFRDAAVDLAVLEVGLGGRLDATNTADPALSVITPVAMDHGAVLGATLAAVAGEKAGVLRAARPAVAWGADPEVRRALAAAAERTGAALTFADDEVTFDTVETRPPAPWGGLRVALTTPRGSYALETPLAGRHQAVNLALAVRAAERLGEAAGSGKPALEALPPEAITAGAAAVSWPGRLESVEVPTGGGGAVRVVLDAAHNPAGAEALAAFLDQAFPDRSPPQPGPIVVFGVLADKEAGGMLPSLARRASRVILTRPPGDRGRDPKELIPYLQAMDGGGEIDAEVIPDPGAALATALRRAAEHHAAEQHAAEQRAAAGRDRGREAPVVIVCGSIFLVGAARGWLRRTHGVPAAR